jgi:ribosomal protein S18 acetylase RimI-like enzyme
LHLIFDIRKADKGDLKEIAYIHKKIFNDHFLGQFPQFLISRYYESYLDENNIFLVSIKDKKVIGFIVGIISSRYAENTINFIKRNAIFLFIFSIFNTWCYKYLYISLKKLIKLLRRIDKNLFKSKKMEKDENLKINQACDFDLLSIGVMSEYQGKGVAKEMLSMFEYELKNMNIINYQLGVHKTNMKAISFYKKQNFIVKYEMNELICFCKIINY